MGAGVQGDIWAFSRYCPQYRQHQLEQPKMPAPVSPMAILRNNSFTRTSPDKLRSQKSASSVITHGVDRSCSSHQSQASLALNDRVSGGPMMRHFSPLPSSNPGSASSSNRASDCCKPEKGGATRHTTSRLREPSERACCTPLAITSA